jgi:hypothetical protein
MPLLSKLDAMVALLAAVAGFAMVEDRNRTEIAPPQSVEITEAATPEVCAEQAEYRRRATRVMLLLTGGMPDTDWQARAQPALPACAIPPASSGPAGRDPPSSAVHSD